MFGRIYKIQNILDNKLYVGKTTKELSSRWNEHCTGHGSAKYLYAAIQRWGVENFVISQIIEVATEHELNDQERYWIAKLNTNVQRNGWGYNLSDGGEGHTTWTDSQKLAKSNAMMGCNNPMFGKNQSEKCKINVATANTGKVRSESHRKAISNAQSTRPRTDNEKRLVSERMTLNNPMKQLTGEKHFFYGKKRPPHTEETRQKCREASLRYWEQRKLSKINE